MLAEATSAVDQLTKQSLEDIVVVVLACLTRVVVAIFSLAFLFREKLTKARADEAKVKEETEGKEDSTEVDCSDCIEELEGLKKRLEAMQSDLDREKKNHEGTCEQLRDCGERAEALHEQYLELLHKGKGTHVEHPPEKPKRESHRRSKEVPDEQ